MAQIISGAAIVEGPLFSIIDQTEMFAHDVPGQVTIKIATATASLAGIMNAQRSRGTVGSPSTLLNGDRIGEFRCLGFDGAVNGAGPSLVGEATENWTPTAHGAKAFVLFAANGSTARVNQFTIDGSAVADEIRMFVFDVSAAALKRVTRGAANSGGAGFRLLLIAN